MCGVFAQRTGQVLGWLRNECKLQIARCSLQLLSPAGPLPPMLQALGWALNRGPLVEPLNTLQFVAVYAFPITPTHSEAVHAFAFEISPLNHAGVHDTDLK